jgi:hypothetical protein
MPSPIPDRASNHGLDLNQANPDSSSSSGVGVDLLHGPDPSVHMLGLPKSHPHLGRWIGLAVLVGVIAALFLVMLAGS